jgi:beta-mannosidase
MAIPLIYTLLVQTSKLLGVILPTQCQVNHLRKMQASFSWDWGPSFPTVGIWRPILLEYFDGISIQQFSPMVQPTISGDPNICIIMYLHNK